MFYCQALQVLLLWGHLGQPQAAGWSLSAWQRFPLGQAMKTPHTTQLKSYVALGFCHLGPLKVETEQALIAKSYSENQCMLCAEQIPRELLQGWGTGKVLRQWTPTSNKTQYGNDWKINQITWQIKMWFWDCKEAGIFLVIFSKTGRRDINIYMASEMAAEMSLYPSQYKLSVGKPLLHRAPVTEVMP